MSTVFFCFQKLVDKAQQYSAFTPQGNFPAHNLYLLKVKVMGSNPGYLLKSFLLYLEPISWVFFFLLFSPFLLFELFLRKKEYEKKKKKTYLRKFVCIETLFKFFPMLLDLWKIVLCTNVWTLYCFLTPCSYSFLSKGKGKIYGFAQV